MNEMFDKVKKNLIWKSVFRRDYRNTVRDRAAAIFGNVFLHIHPVKVRESAVKLRYTWGMETLFLHEAVPGHHFQISLAQENAALPAFMRFGGNTAYVEGWALYAEQLADELGAYENDPVGQIGYLQSLMFRAARLVVDTGIHSKQWSVKQATDYMVEKTGFARPRCQRDARPPPRQQHQQPRLDGPHGFVGHRHMGATDALQQGFHGQRFSVG